MVNLHSMRLLYGLIDPARSRLLAVRCPSNIRISVQVNLPSMRLLSGLITQKKEKAFCAFSSSP